MSQHGADQILQVGYLRSCMDRRFVAATRHKFEEVTRLTADRYYHEAFAGGLSILLLFLLLIRTPMVPTMSITTRRSIWR